MLIILFVIFALSLLILGHEAGHFFAAKLFGLKVDEFGIGFPPRIFAWRPKGGKSETEYSFNWLPFGGFVRIAGENDHMEEKSRESEANAEDRRRRFSFQPAWRKAVILAAGVGVNFIIGWFLLSIVLMMGTPSIVAVSEVVPDSPAQDAGLKTGDVIKDFSLSEDFIRYINDHRGEPITLTILRGNEEVNITATPRVAVLENQGALGVVLAQGGAEPEPFFRAIFEGLKESGAMMWFTLVGFYEIIRGLFATGNLIPGIVGPVGIVGIAEQASQIGFAYLLQLISLISLNLAVLNLIPFPALDGGRLFMVVIEKIKGSPLSRKTEIAVNTFGFVALIFLMIAVTVRDIINL